MYFNKLSKVYVGLFMFTSMLFSQDVTLSFGTVDEAAGTAEVIMTNSVDVAGFQFDMSGLDVTGASGGSSVANGFMVSTSATTVIRSSWWCWFNC